MNEIAESYLRLSLIPNVGPATLHKLIAKFGSPIDALKATRADLLSLERVGEKIADAFVKGRDEIDLDSVKRRLSAFKAEFISIDDERYPKLLRNLYDAPIGLYVAGKADLNAPSIAVVGCRNCSVYGQLSARKISASLANSGLTVVSGLARGIDSAAHWGALDSSGKTVAVLGCGIDIVYPPENIDLYRRVIETGAVVSEYPFGKRADRATFPMRNRIIAGMAMATLLVESGIRGGGMITARIACDLGRDVFAVPGRISEPESAGCHLLIREGARLITSASDIVEELGFSGRLKFSAEPAAKNSESSGGEIVLEGDEAAVYSALKSAGCPLAADEIVQSANLPISKVLAAALMLELKNAIAKQGDGRWTAAPR